MPLAPLIYKRLKIVGSTLRARSLKYKIRLTRDFSSKCLPLFEDGTLRPVIDEVFPWHKVQQAHRYMEANKNKGKVILTMDG